MLVAGHIPLAVQYDQTLARTRSEYVADHHNVATQLTGFDALPTYAMVWLAINRSRFVRQECSSERSN